MYNVTIKYQPNDVDAALPTMRREAYAATIGSHQPSRGVVDIYRAFTTGRGNAARFDDDGGRVSVPERAGHVDLGRIDAGRWEIRVERIVFPHNVDLGTMVTRVPWENFHHARLDRCVCEHQAFDIGVRHIVRCISNYQLEPHIDATGVHARLHSVLKRGTVTVRPWCRCHMDTRSCKSTDAFELVAKSGDILPIRHRVPDLDVPCVATFTGIVRETAQVSVEGVVAEQGHIRKSRKRVPVLRLIAFATVLIADMAPNGIDTAQVHVLPDAHGFEVPELAMLAHVLSAFVPATRYALSVQGKGSKHNGQDGEEVLHGMLVCWFTGFFVYIVSQKTTIVNSINVLINMAI